LKVPKCIGTFTPDGENESNFEMLGVEKPKQTDSVQNNRLPYSTDSVSTYLAKNAASGSLLVFMSISKHLCTSPSRKKDKKDTLFLPAESAVSPNFLTISASPETSYK